MALSWYNQYVIDKSEKERNIHDFILCLRKKVVLSIAADLRWKKWEEYKHSKLRPNASVNDHAQKCLEFYNDCLDKQGNKMINMHALKHKFVDKILTPIRIPLKMQVNWDMTLEEIIVVAEKIQVLNAHDPARGITTPQGTFYYKDGKKIRQQIPEDRGRSPKFTKSNWRPGRKYDAPAGSPPAKKNFPKKKFTPRPQQDKPQQFRQMDDKEKEKLKAEGKCLICKRSRYYARDCPNKKQVSTVYNQVQYESRPPTNPWKMRNLRSAYEKLKTAETTVMRSPTDNRKYLIPQTNKVTNAVKILINGHEAQVLLDPRTEHGNLISNIFTTLKNISTQETEPKTLETAIKGSKSKLHHKVIAELDVQGHKEQVLFYVCNLKTWDAILGEPALSKLNAVMYTAENRVTIQPRGKPEQELIMLDKNTDKQISTASNYIAPDAESISDYSGNRTPDMHLQKFLTEWRQESPEPSKPKRKLSPIPEELEEPDAHTIKKLKQQMQETLEKVETSNQALYQDLEKIGNNLQTKIDQYQEQLREVMETTI